MRTLAVKEPSHTQRRQAEVNRAVVQPSHRSLSSGVLQRKSSCACGGGCPRCQEQALLQTKLKISEPGDQYEQEADRIADEVMQMPEPAIQRQMEPEEDEEEEMVQRQAIANQTSSVQQQESTEVPPIVQEVFSAPGQTLDADTRAFMESRFGHDFSQVRMHIDAQASEVAHEVNALAYTVGRDVVFGAGQYAPQTLTGRKLLAHELTHVLQQQGASTLESNLNLVSSYDPLEREADAVTDQILANGNISAGLSPSGFNHRSNQWNLARKPTPQKAPAKPKPTTPLAKTTACISIHEADALELADAKATLQKSQRIAKSIVPAKASSDLAYWFAELYYYITLNEILNRSDFEHPSFVMHFIPIFYDMYSENAEYFSKGESSKISSTWLVHFGIASTPTNPSNLLHYLAMVTFAVVSAVSVHIIDDMPVALEQAYRTYVAKYCLKMPFDTFKKDFFEKNLPIFDKVRVQFMNELVNLGTGLAVMQKSVNPNLISNAADIFGGPLKIKDIYAWRETAWQIAKSNIEGKAKQNK
jgi:Domain of unknown function (DUF4157)